MAAISSPAWHCRLRHCLAPHTQRRLRGISRGKVDGLIEASTEGRLFGLLGEARVNVLALNMALDGLKRVE